MIKNEVRDGIIMMIVGILLALIGFGIIVYYETLSDTVNSRVLSKAIQVRNIGGILASYGILFIFFGGIFIAYGYD